MTQAMSDEQDREEHMQAAQRRANLYQKTYYVFRTRTSAPGGWFFTSDPTIHPIYSDIMDPIVVRPEKESE